MEKKFWYVLGLKEFREYSWLWIFNIVRVDPLINMPYMFVVKLMLLNFFAVKLFATKKRYVYEKVNERKK